MCGQDWRCQGWARQQHSCRKGVNHDSQALSSSAEVLSSGPWVWPEVTSNCDTNAHTFPEGDARRPERAWVRYEEVLDHASVCTHRRAQVTQVYGR